MDEDTCATNFMIRDKYVQLFPAVACLCVRFFTRKLLYLCATLRPADVMRTLSARSAAARQTFADGIPLRSPDPLAAHCSEHRSGAARVLESCMERRSVRSLCALPRHPACSYRHGFLSFVRSTKPVALADPFYPCPFRFMPCASHLSTPVSCHRDLTKQANADAGCKG